MTPLSLSEVRALLAPDYRVTDFLGHGGYGSVFKASRHSDGELVAIKVQRCEFDDEDDTPSVRRARFDREAKLCAALEHPRIVRLLEHGQRNDYQFIVFEFVPGETLTKVLARRGVLPIAEAIGLMSQLLEALRTAHARGIVHRDLKPDNLMVLDGRAEIKVLDFGVAAFAASAPEASPMLTRSREILGTPSYSAPEQLRGEMATSRSDLYAWGLVLLECLTGERVMDGATMAQVFHKQLSPLEIALPHQLATHPLGAVLRRVLTKSPRSRASDAGQVLEELNRIPPTELLGTIQLERPSLPRTLALRATEPTTEQRQATVVSCSLYVVPTPQCRADVEVLDAIARDQIKLGEEVASRHGGTIVGILASRFVVAFGIPEASENDARRAGRAAMDLANQVKARSTGLLAQQGVELDFRIGVHTDVLLVDGDGVPSGPAINLATRLESLATPSTVLLSKASQALLGKRFHLVPDATLGFGSFNGSPDLFRLVTDQHVDPLGAAHAEQLIELIGRDDELETLLQAWASARAGKGSVFLLRGEPGIGKTRLAREVHSRAKRAGATTFDCQCQPEDRHSALRPLLDQLRRRLAAESGFSVPPANDDAGRIFQAWLSGDDRRESATEHALSAELERELLLTELTRRLCPATSDEPRLLLIEDVHWADPTTRELIGRMVARAVDRPMMLMLTARPELALDGQSIGVLDLKRLDQSAVRRLAQSSASNGTLSDGQLREVVERTDGIPLFVEELTRALLDSGSSAPRGRRDSAVPYGLRDLLHGRLDRLGAAKDTAQLASAIGRDFELSMLTRLSHRDGGSLATDLEILLDAQIVQLATETHTSAYHFRHALFQEAAAESMPPARRRSVHARIAAELEALHAESGRPDHARLAWHYQLAGDAAKAIAQRALASQSAMSGSAYGEAIEHLQTALGLNEAIDAENERNSTEIDLRNAVGAALIASQGFATPPVLETFTRSEELLRACRPSPAQRFTTLKGLWTFHNARANYAAAQQIVDQLFELARAEGSSEQHLAVHECATLTSMLTGDYRAAAHYGSSSDEWYGRERQHELAARYGHDPWLSTVSFEAIASVLLGRIGRAEARLSSGFEVLAAVRSASHEAGFLGQAAMVMLMIGSVGPRDNEALTRCVDFASRAVGIAQRFGLSFAAGYGGLLLAMRGTLTGDENSVAGLQQALKIWDMLGIRASVSWSLAILAQGQHKMRRYGEALESAHAALSHCEAYGEGHGASEVQRTLGALFSDPDSPYADPSRAQGHFEEALGIAERRGARWLELRAAYSFTRQTGSRPARDRLASSLAWFTDQKEGLETALFKDAVATLS